MNLHEYQAKNILASYGVGVQRGKIAETPEEAVLVAQQLAEETNTKAWVVKAQIHAGGRGKGGGVKFSPTLEKVKENAQQILGMQLTTPQTPPEGKRVNMVLVAEDMYYEGENEIKEYYFSILLNRQTGRNIIIYSTEGGMDIEQVAENTPHLIFREEIDPKVGLLPFQGRKMAFNLGLKGDAFKDFLKFVDSLYKAYTGIDATLIEINPLLKTSDNKIVAVDSKIVLDNNALFRHPDLAKLRDKREEDPTDVKAGEAGLNFIKLDGNVGCMVNGAGLAMATMDIIKVAGGSPANFLDVGGTANAERVEKAFNIILKDPNVKTILINIFGGIVRCDRVAQGIVDAYKNLGNLPVPLIVRLQGTNAEEAKTLIDEAGLNVHSVRTLEEVAEKIKEILG
ncbi:MAG: ADP-forming succinate--CoA ligase subunit beta [Flavobacteriaceae bacterium]|nr:ADP-forming succinate--CoA ligase subunit beta [Flavobacteriaceae bacterium]